MSKFLEWLGLHVMTNREALIEELVGLSDAEFAHMIMGGNSALPGMLMRAMCRDCKAGSDGACPHPNGGCTRTIDEWFAEPCMHERLLVWESEE